jgi:hypothetical protein
MVKRARVTLPAVIDRADLPADVQDLPEPRLRAWLVLASGGRYADASREAGVPKNTVWRWARDQPFRDLLDSRMLPLADAATETLESRIEHGMMVDATEREQAMGLRAAELVMRGLGIGTNNGAARASQSNVQVNVSVGGVLPSEPPPVLDGAPSIADRVVSVVSTQPRRSKPSSRRSPKATKDQGK